MWYKSKVSYLWSMYFLSSTIWCPSTLYYWHTCLWTSMFICPCLYSTLTDSRQSYIAQAVHGITTKNDNGECSTPSFYTHSIKKYFEAFPKYYFSFVRTVINKPFLLPHTSLTHSLTNVYRKNWKCILLRILAHCIKLSTDWLIKLRRIHYKTLWAILVHPSRITCCGNCQEDCAIGYGS